MAKGLSDSTARYGVIAAASRQIEDGLNSEAAISTNGLIYYIEVSLLVSLSAVSLVTSLKAATSTSLALGRACRTGINGSVSRCPSRRAEATRGFKEGTSTFLKGSMRRMQATGRV